MMLFLENIQQVSVYGTLLYDTSVDDEAAVGLDGHLDAAFLVEL